MAEDGLCSKCKGICSNLKSNLFEREPSLSSPYRSISGYGEGNRIKIFSAPEETEYCWSFKPQQEEDIFEVGRCVLCHFVEQIVERNIVAKQEFFNSKIERYQLRSYVFGINELHSYYRLRSEQKSLALSIVYRKPELPAEQEKAIVCIRVNRNPVPQPGDCQIRPLKANIGRFRDWLHYCEKNHQMFCVPVLRSDNLKYRLIDVREQCIVDAPLRVAGRQGRIRYIALSYVWGTQPQKLVLNTINENELRKVGALDVHKPSRTILDAINLVQLLGERYLWVDALCIMQDDTTDIAYAIPKMGQIYQYAVLTIAAAAGNSPEARLPGIEDGTRQYAQEIIEFGGLSLMTAAVPPLFSPDALSENSNYNRRAWTFQERLLSVRCLIFTPEQVYWECRSRSWSEDTFTLPEWQFTAARTGQLKLPSLQSIPKPLLMTTLVSQYTARELSFPSDALNAFTGVLSLYNAIYLEQFFWALTTSDFYLQLLWQSSSDTLRDGLKTGLDAEFPTWSWLSWSGPTTLFHKTRLALLTCHITNLIKPGANYGSHVF
jgi:Heterokaryon incompatibility protein (HET)